MRQKKNDHLSSQTWLYKIIPSKLYNLRTENNHSIPQLSTWKPVHLPSGSTVLVPGRLLISEKQFFYVRTCLVLVRMTTGRVNNKHLF